MYIDCTVYRHMKKRIDCIMFIVFRSLFGWFLFYIATIWISGCGGSIRLTRLNALTEIEEDDLPVNNICSSKVSKAKLL